MNQPLLLIAYCSVGSALVPAIVGSLKFKQRSPQERILEVLVVFSFLFDLQSILVRSVSVATGNVYRVFEFFLLTAIYYYALGKRNLITFVLCGVFYLLFYLVNIFYMQRGEIVSFSNTLAAIFFMTFSLGYFYYLMREMPITNIQRLPMFWINTGVLIYFAGNFFVFVMLQFLKDTLNDEIIFHWSFHNFLNIVKNILFALALWQHLRKHKPI